MGKRAQLAALNLIIRATLKYAKIFLNWQIFKALLYNDLSFYNFEIYKMRSR